MSLRVMLAQCNPVVGALRQNLHQMKKYIAEAKHSQAQILVFPELMVEGYPPEDLLLKPHFISDSLKITKEVIKLSTKDLLLIFGSVRTGGVNAIFNAATVAYAGKEVARYHKRKLPNYGVFDERRYFTKGDKPLVINYNGKSIGITICEDIWPPNNDILKELKPYDIDLLINLSASPYSLGKQKIRERFLSHFASKMNTALAYNNILGGQDELVFDGRSMVFGPDGRLISRSKSFCEDSLLFSLPNKTKKITSKLNRLPPDYKIKTSAPNKPLMKDKKNPISKKIQPTLSSLDEVWKALVLGTRDYLQKNRFEGALIGMSGGIDSALVAAIAVEAIGADKVWVVSMPSAFNSVATINDARLISKNLKIKFSEIPIRSLYEGYLDELQAYIDPKEPKLAGENLQARIRGNILMALSNNYGHIVLTTGNKSELAMGYCTLYGDMAGGFAVLKDVPKTTVFKLAKHYNALRKKTIIPLGIIKRPPSAELRPNQKDSDSLPLYSVLDPILEAYIEKDDSVTQIKSKEHSVKMISDIIRKVDQNEYKRRQSPPGIKITYKAFGRDRRMPITNMYKK